MAGVRSLQSKKPQGPLRIARVISKVESPAPGFCLKCYDGRLNIPVI